MKTIKLHNGATFTSQRVLKEVLELPPQGCTISAMRQRIKIMDAIEAAEGDQLQLEDADYELLKGQFQAFQFRLAHKDLVAIADGFD
jgi:hypothetical protein